MRPSGAWPPLRPKPFDRVAGRKMKRIATTRVPKPAWSRSKHYGPVRRPAISSGRIWRPGSRACNSNAPDSGRRIEVPMSRLTRKWLLLGGLGGVMALVLTGCNNPPKPVEPPQGPGGDDDRPPIAISEGSVRLRAVAKDHGVGHNSSHGS